VYVGPASGDWVPRAQEYVCGWLTERTTPPADCTPYLLNLGLTKSNTSLIWIAGPLSGLVVQPIAGVIADENTSKWGRRRPLMVASAVIVAASLLVLGFTREIVALVVADGESATRPTIFLAVVAIYVVDFAINVGMSSPCNRVAVCLVLTESPSHVVLQEPHCRYASARDAADWRGVGYVQHHASVSLCVLY